MTNRMRHVRDIVAYSGDGTRYVIREFQEVIDTSTQEGRDEMAGRLMFMVGQQHANSLGNGRYLIVGPDIEVTAEGE